MKDFLSFIPVAKPAETAAGTVCGLIDNGIKILNTVNKDADLNAGWKKARLSSPGTGLILKRVCTDIAGDIGSVCTDSIRPA
ncbi:hypothetical protein [Nonomuraea sp. NPDC049480]|uniref:hypothetical protein n=1 Tax=Nonomuraea sp. NPDC049480 TaxID=3364353 RepID=UPI0037B038E4